MLKCEVLLLHSLLASDAEVWSAAASQSFSSRRLKCEVLLLHSLSAPDVWSVKCCCFTVIQLQTSEMWSATSSQSFSFRRWSVKCCFTVFQLQTSEMWSATSSQSFSSRRLKCEVLLLHSHSAPDCDRLWKAPCIRLKVVSRIALHFRTNIQALSSSLIHEPSMAHCMYLPQIY
jgi:hypothetical protein